MRKSYRDEDVEKKRLGPTKLNFVNSAILQGLILPSGQGLRLSLRECAALSLSFTLSFRFNIAKSFNNFSDSIS